jgi:hypothetical protein
VNQTCLALPVLMGRTGHVRRLMLELNQAQHGDDCLERRVGVERASWYLAATPLGELLIAHLELEDFAQSTALLAHSRHDFDSWFSAGLRDSTGIDLGAGDSISRPELLRSWSASRKKGT